MMFIYSIVLFAPVVIGQLILGPCPRPPPFEQNLDLKQYSGDWYVLAQTARHPLSAANCQRVKYSFTNGSLSANFSYMDSQMNRKISKHGVIKTDFRPPVGNMHLKFDDFPRLYQFHVLKANYTNVAVEYTCLSGVFNYTASVTVLHRRKPSQITDLNTVVNQFNLKSVVPIQFRKEMKLIYVIHTGCNDPLDMTAAIGKGANNLLLV